MGNPEGNSIKFTLSCEVHAVYVPDPPHEDRILLHEAFQAPVELAVTVLDKGVFGQVFAMIQALVGKGTEASNAADRVLPDQRQRPPVRNQRRGATGPVGRG